MKLRTVLCLTLLTLGTLACSGMEMPNVGVSPPWDKLDLPTEDGKVLYSSDTSISIVYEGNHVKELTPEYRDALTNAGYAKVADTESGDTAALVYEKDGKTVSAGLSYSNGQTVVGLTMQ